MSPPASSPPLSATIGRYLGWPEKLFVRINSILPRLVDQSLIKQSALCVPLLLTYPLIPFSESHYVP